LDRLALIAVLLLPGCAARQMVPFAAGADLVTTELALSRTPGTWEANPLPGAQTTGGRVAIKALGTVVVVWMCEWLEGAGHHRGAEILKWGTVALWGAAATWNAAYLK
jgi:hypothetical protein